MIMEPKGNRRKSSQVKGLEFDETLESCLFPRATSQMEMLAFPFGDCREGQIPRSLLRCKFDALSACCRVFDLTPKKQFLLQGESFRS